MSPPAGSFVHKFPCPTSHLKVFLNVASRLVPSALALCSATASKYGCSRYKVAASRLCRTNHTHPV